MEINITKQPTKIIAVNKKTKERKDVNLLHIGSRTFNCADESTWGTWHNYSKRGDWNLYIDIDNTELQK